MDSIEIIVRPYDPNVDAPYVYNSWTKNGWYGMEKYDRPSDKRQWFADKIKLINGLIEICPVLIACHKEDPNTIAGYSVFSGGEPVHTHLKADYRNAGIEELFKRSIEGEANGKT